MKFKIRDKEYLVRFRYWLAQEVDFNGPGFKDTRVPKRTIKKLVHPTDCSIKEVGQKDDLVVGTVFRHINDPDDPKAARKKALGKALKLMGLTKGERFEVWRQVFAQMKVIKRNVTASYYV